MKIEVVRENVQKAVDLAQGVADPRSIRPELQDICFRCGEDWLEVSATDLDVGVRAILTEGVEVKEAGGIALLAPEIASIFRESPDEKLTMETAKEEAICHIHGRGSEYHIAGQDVEDFPGVPPMPEGEVLEIEAQIFGEMIQKTRFAAASEAMRYALNGILIAGKKGDKTIEMVGADGRRLAHIKRKANTPCPVDLRAIVSLKCASHMERLLSESEGAIKLRFGERQVWLAGGAVTLMGLLVEGHYPNYEEVIPDDCDKRAVLDLGALVSAVRRAAVVTTDESRGVTFSFAPKQLVVCSQSAERGSAKVEIEAEYDGPAAEIRFNSDYVLDMLKVADEERIQFEFKEAARPAILRAGRNYQYVVMPITEGSV